MTVAAADPAGPAGPDWRARLAGWAALAAAAAAPLIAYVGNLGFAPLMALGGLAAAPVLIGRRSPSTPYLVLCLALGWAFVSLAWSPIQFRAFPRYKDVEAFTGLKLVLELALYGAFVRAASLASPRTARAAMLALGLGLAVVGVLLLVETAFGAALYQWIKSEAHQATRPDLARRNVARATYALVLLIWPAGVVLVRRGWGWLLAPAGLGALVGALGLGVDAPLVALVASVAAFAGMRYLGGRFTLALAALVALYILGAPILLMTLEGLLPAHGAPGHIGKESWGVRLDVWRFTVSKIELKPWFGWGLDASRAFPSLIPLHPHNFALQMWLELGSVGATIASAFWSVALIRADNLRLADRNLGAAAGAAIIAYVAIGAISFGAWQEWWLALGALTAACVALAARARNAPPVSPRAPSGL